MPNFLPNVRIEILPDRTTKLTTADGGELSFTEYNRDEFTVRYREYDGAREQSFDRATARFILDLIRDLGGAS